VAHDAEAQQVHHQAHCARRRDDRRKELIRQADRKMHCETRSAPCLAAHPAANPHPTLPNLLIRCLI
jgi:hypothetical protein